MEGLHWLARYLAGKRNQTGWLWSNEAQALAELKRRGIECCAHHGEQQACLDGSSRVRGHRRCKLCRSSQSQRTFHRGGQCRCCAAGGVLELGRSCSSSCAGVWILHGRTAVIPEVPCIPVCELLGSVVRSQGNSAPCEAGKRVLQQSGICSLHLRAVVRQILPPSFLSRAVATSRLTRAL